MNKESIENDIRTSLTRALKLVNGQVGVENDSVIDKAHQIIFYGAPGTGKSHTVNETTSQQPKENVIRTTFHPDSDYSTFVGCYKPTKTLKPVRNVAGDIVKENGKEVFEETITYQFVPQAFTSAYIRSWQIDKPVFLVIEEINRGNCAQIFGDLFQLLDRKDNKSEYPVKADTDLGKFIAETFQKEGHRKDIEESVLNGSELVLPANLYIWATMNTSDQSLFPIDSAFKRRWEWKYVPIADAGLNYTLQIGESKYNWWQFIDKINTDVENATKSEDKKLGYFFAQAENNIISADTFVSKVLFYLWNDVFKDSYAHTIFKVGETDYSFHKFFLPNGDVNTEMVNQFLHDNGIEPTE